MTKEKSDSGAIIIETSIALPIFILVIVFMYSILIVVLTQNTMTHTLIQTTDSLALDEYIADSYKDNWWKSVSSIVISIARLGNSEYFSIEEKIADLVDDDPNQANEIAKKRFVGYLTGGDENAAESKLDALSVVDGLDGITFTAEVDGEDLTITIEYYIQFPIDAFGAGEIHMKQSFTSKLWS